MSKYHLHVLKCCINSPWPTEQSWLAAGRSCSVYGRFPRRKEESITDMETSWQTRVHSALFPTRLETNEFWTKAVPRLINLIELL